jgi:hypothetical protein
MWAADPLKEKEKNLREGRGVVLILWHEVSPTPNHIYTHHWVAEFSLAAKRLTVVMKRQDLQ